MKDKEVFNVSKLNTADLSGKIELYFEESLGLI
jgi:hypothetical protein